MKKGLSCSLVFIMIVLLCTSVPLAEADAIWEIDPVQENGQVSAHHDALWTLPPTEVRYTLTKRLRMGGKEAFRFTEKLYISFGKSGRSSLFDIKLYNSMQTLSYIQGMEIYREIKLNLASLSFLTKRKAANEEIARPFLTITV